MFEVGCTYQTKSGRRVMVVRASNIGTSKHEVVGDDGFPRYGSGDKAGQPIGDGRSDGLTLVQPK